MTHIGRDEAKTSRRWPNAMTPGFGRHAIRRVASLPPAICRYSKCIDVAYIELIFLEFSKPFP